MIIGTLTEASWKNVFPQPVIPRKSPWSEVMTIIVSSIRPVFFQPVEQHAHLVVALLDQPHIGGQNLVADVVAGKSLAYGCVLKALEHGMVGFAFGVAAHGGRKCSGPYMPA